jgi:hypothetical protein
VVQVAAVALGWAEALCVLLLALAVIWMLAAVLEAWQDLNRTPLRHCRCGRHTLLSRDQHHDAGWVHRREVCQPEIEAL